MCFSRGSRVSENSTSVIPKAFIQVFNSRSNTDEKMLETQVTLSSPKPDSTHIGHKVRGHWISLSLHVLKGSYYMIKPRPTLILNLLDYNTLTPSFTKQNQMFTKHKIHFYVHISYNIRLVHMRIPTWSTGGFNLWRMCLLKILYQTWETWNVWR